jgi:DNA-binding winged helix-turn-helix (wHTH) protein
MTGKNLFAYQFGPYRLEPGRGLMRAGTLVPLSPKEFALLEMLVKRRGEIVSHQEMWSQVWPEQDVSCESITRCIYVLRRTLGGEQQAYINTVARRGYRMSVPVTRVERPARESLIEKSIKSSPRAYAHFQEGMREANLTGADHQQRAIDLFEKAYQLDAGYAVPLGAIADRRMYQLIRGWITPH